MKLVDALSSIAENIGQRGRAVAFGNTLPELDERVFGVEQRGEKGDGNFKPLTGEGYVAPRKADYEHALSVGCEVALLAFETFGGFSPGVVRYLKRLSYEVRNKLNHQQYDLTTWSARSWLSFQTQQLSAKLHISCAWEIANELGFAAAAAVAAPRPRRRHSGGRRRRRASATAWKWFNKKESDVFTFAAVLDRFEPFWIIF